MINPAEAWEELCQVMTWKGKHWTKVLTGKEGNQTLSVHWGKGCCCQGLTGTRCFPPPPLSHPQSRFPCSAGSQPPAPQPSLSAGPQPFLPHISHLSTLPAPNLGLCTLLVTTLSTSTQKELCRRDGTLSYSLFKIYMFLLVSTNSWRQAVTVPPPGHLGPERPEVTDELNELANTSGRQAALIKIGH